MGVEGKGNVLVTHTAENGRQETVKHLRAEDYIPVGMVMDMDGKTVRVDGVDFARDEAALTDISDKRHPKPLCERLSIVRSYVEDAPSEKLWEAIDARNQTAQKKTSVLAKLKEKSQSTKKAERQAVRTGKAKTNEMEM